jgi:plasmid stabilization system protein ParE
MSRRVHYAPWFDADLHFRTAWYAEAGGEELAERFVTAVKTTVSKLSDNPRLGWRPYPRDSDLDMVYAMLVERPFRKHILFYRFAEEDLFLERLIHGARDLPQRLREPPSENV